MHLASLRLYRIHPSIQSSHPLCSPYWKKRYTRNTILSVRDVRASGCIYQPPQPRGWYDAVCYYRNFSIGVGMGGGDICRAATVARNATETRRVLLLFLLFNRNARWCSSTSGSNLLPVRLHRPIDNRAATTTSLVCTYVRTCSFMLLIFKCASVETVLFPPSPSLEHVFVSRSQERYYMRVLYSSLSRGTNNTKIYRNNDVQRYFIAKRQSVEMYYNRYRIIYRIGHRCCRHYFWQLSHNLKHVTVLSVLNSFRILNRGDIRSYYAQLNTY